MSLFFAEAKEIGQQLIKLEQTVCVAESSTGGLIAANLLAMPGASNYFVGGSVVYTQAARRAFLDFDWQGQKRLKPLSEEMVLAFAVAARKKLATSWSIAELGATGPAGTPYGHGPGVCVIGIDGPRTGQVKITTGSGNREENMLAFTKAALTLFQQVLSEV
ncbi:MAG: CinA family protein [Pseudomonadales bacterium]|nr:CinA family protein [Pseudomonadales bacterium]